MRAAIIVLACLLTATGPALAGAEIDAALIPLRVQRVVLVDRAPAVLLVDEPGERYLLVFVDLFMANAIRMGMDGTHLERPLTHDLMGALLLRTGARLTRVSITELRDNTYYARIGLQINGQETSVDARPSDALALAVRQGTPVFGAAGLLKPLRDAPNGGPATEDPPPPADGSRRRI